MCLTLFMLTLYDSIILIIYTPTYNYERYICIFVANAYLQGIKVNIFVLVINIEYKFKKKIHLNVLILLNLHPFTSLGVF